jgi:peroxiredoxin
MGDLLHCYSTPNLVRSHLRLLYALHKLGVSGSYGCTQQVCQFRDALSGERCTVIRRCGSVPHLLMSTEKDVFKSSSINVIGISPDSVKDQKKFKDKHNLSVSHMMFSKLHLTAD